MPTFAQIFNPFRGHMNLVIDVGNSFAKASVFEKDRIIFTEQHADFDRAMAENLLVRFPGIRSCIIGSVRDLPDDIGEWFPAYLHLLIPGPYTKYPVQHRYRTFNTLGIDRIAAVVAASHLFPAKDVLVIEAGTCITYDLIDAGGTYQGGSISPGIRLRFKALHTFTDKLPLIQAIAEAPLTGDTTEASIQSGVINGVKAEVEGIMARYLDRYENLTIILSGGDSHYFDKMLKNNIFAVPNIVLTGLNLILAFNDKK